MDMTVDGKGNQPAQVQVVERDLIPLIQVFETPSKDFEVSWTIGVVDSVRLL